MPYKDPAKQKAAQRMHYERNKELFAHRTFMRSVNKPKAVSRGNAPQP